MPSPSEQYLDLAAGLLETVRSQQADIKTAADWFAESQGCYVISTACIAEVKGRLAEAGVEYDVCGTVAPHQDVAIDGRAVRLEDLRTAHESFFPELMASEL